MCTGPGARVFFADDPTAPGCVHELAEAPAGVLGALGEVVGPDVDFLYTKAVWKDAEVQTGFGWHWDHTYWGGAPKFSTWLALDDADESNGCLKLVAGSHRLVPALLERFSPSFRRAREHDEDPWRQTSGAPPTKGDDFIIDEHDLDAFLAARHPPLQRSNEPASAGDAQPSACRNQRRGGCLPHGAEAAARPPAAAPAGDCLFFSSSLLHASHRNVQGSADRWALISTYRDASTPDASKVFPAPRPVLRRGCPALGRKAHAEHPPDAVARAARYVLPGSPYHSAAAAEPGAETAGAVH